MKRLIVTVAAMLAHCATAFGQAPVSFEGKTVTMMTGAPAPVDAAQLREVGLQVIAHPAKEKEQEE